MKNRMHLRTPFIWIAFSGLAPLGVAQTTSNRVTNTSDGILAGVVALGNLTPAKTTSVNSAQVQFRVRSKQTAGYRVDATATFAVVNTALAAGGTSIAASDIGVGIT